MALLIDGKRISAEIKDELKEEVVQLKEQGITGALAVIQVGNDPASSVYVRNKKRACEYIGIDSLSYELPEETSQDELLALIDKLNKEEHVKGILVQLPLPEGIDEDAVIRAISPKKDVDGFMRSEQRIGYIVLRGKCRYRRSEIDRLLADCTVAEDAATLTELKRNHTLRTGGGKPKGRRT